MMRTDSLWPYSSDGVPIWRVIIDQYGCPPYLDVKRRVYPIDGDYNNPYPHNLTNSPRGMYELGYRLSQHTWLTPTGLLVNKHNEPYPFTYLDNSQWPAYQKERRIIPSLMFEHFNIPKLKHRVYPKDGDYTNTHPSNYTFDKPQKIKIEKKKILNLFDIV